MGYGHGPKPPGGVGDYSPRDSQRARWAAAGWRDVDVETQVHGLATTGGLVSTTGVGGFTLGGGIGWLMRKHGLACDNLVGAEMVTADGEVVHASESQNADLLWALRGGGGNFGVVTSFLFKVHPISTVVGGPMLWHMDQAAEVLRWYRDFFTSTFWLPSVWNSAYRPRARSPCSVTITSSSFIL